jgi:N utilization substance protein B
LQALYQWHVAAHDPAEIIVQFLAEQDFAQADSALFQDLVMGVARAQPEIESRLQPHIDRPWKQLDLIEKIILSLGAYELLWHAEVPARVILGEAIDLARRFGAEQGHKFVNGVLDKAAREWRGAELKQVGGVED